MRTIEEIEKAAINAKSIEEAFNCSVETIGLLDSIIGNIQLSRLEEICNAEREGKCVVLPCKVGDALYKVVELVNGERFISDGKMFEYIVSPAGKEIYFSEETTRYSIWLDAEQIGKTVFLTREAAEAALNGGGE